MTSREEIPDLLKVGRVYNNSWFSKHVNYQDDNWYLDLSWKSTFAFVCQLDDVIDLVIPRGSNKLVSQIKNSTKIPVLGHAGETNNIYPFVLV